MVGDTIRALSYANEWSRLTTDEFKMVDSLDVVRSLGDVALAAGRPADALRLWHIADVRGCVACFFTRYAQAFDQMQQPDSARVWYEKYVTGYGHDQSDVFVIARVYRRLGELYEERRQWDKAMKMYQELATLWEKADPALQPTVEDMKARIARLRKLVG